MHGLIFVDKPVGVTSHDVVARVRAAARTKRVGHAGTLDPFATGLLVIAIGQYTRLLPYIVGEPKVYEATIRFGAETDSDDATGRITVEASLPASTSSIALANAMATLTGPIDQIPPAFSAKHVDGQRAYALARRGNDVVLPPSRVHVHRWTVLYAAADCVNVRIECGGGTYVRALARDLGRALGSAAHCETLRRVACGAVHVDHAVPMDRLHRGAIAEGAIVLQSPLALLGDVAHETLDAGAMRELTFGRAVRATGAGARAALLHDGQVVAMGVRTPDDRWQPKVVLLDGVSLSEAGAVASGDQVA